MNVKLVEFKTDQGKQAKSMIEAWVKFKGGEGVKIVIRRDLFRHMADECGTNDLTYGTAKIFGV